MTDNAQNRRLSKGERRAQLLDVARAIIQESGVHGLTLAHLATAAEVSKPIVYDHFETREALLVALYRAINAMQMNRLLETLRSNGSSRSVVTGAIARAYIRCHRDAGPEGKAVLGALLGTPEMTAVHAELTEGFVEFMTTRLASFTAMRRKSLRRHSVAITGAAEALSREVLEGRLSEPLAVHQLQAMIEWALARDV